MHDREDWPRRGGGGGGRRRGWYEEHGEGPEHGEPWGPSHPVPPRGPMRHAPGWFGGGKHFWMAEGPMRRTRVKRGDVRAAALALLAEEPRNGYQIIQELSARSGGAWQPSPGSVYPALQQLEDEGLIRAENVEGSRRAYSLTEEGREYVSTHADEVNAPWEAVAGRERSSMREMRALVGQLAMAAMQVTNAGSDAQISEAQRILSDTRRSLYRILAAEDEEGAAEQPSADSSPEK